jgi:2-polyprenyl-3-methyl-5-hydroxy-6-metoxy-1,4-benzoquinol methylase
MTQTHVYERSLDTREGVQDSLSLIFHKIQNNSLVLDVGAGSGALGRALKKHKQCQVHGLSYNADEVKALEGQYDLVMQMDLELDALPDTITRVQYDCIVCADVLEHLRNASQVLNQLLRLLKPNGCLILSVPNVSHFSVITGLLAGRFARTHEGLLDATHVHFFERQSLDQFCIAAGARVVHCDAVRKSMIQTEFSDLDSSLLPPSLTDFIAQTPDADIYQFIWTLELESESASLQSNHASSITHPVRPQIDLAPQFEIKLYGDYGQGFHEESLVCGYGNYREGIQCIQLAMKQPTTPLHSVRLDWPQWPGLYEWQAFECIDALGQIIFSWNGAWSSSANFVGCTMLAQTGDNEFPTLMVHGTHPHIQIALPDALAVSSVNILISPPIRIPVAQAQFLTDASKQDLAFRGIFGQLNSLGEVTEQKLNWQSTKLHHIDDVLEQKLNWQSAKLHSMDDALEQKLGWQSVKLHTISDVFEQKLDLHSSQLQILIETQEKQVTLLKQQLHDLQDRNFIVPNVFKLIYRRMVKISSQKQN